MVRPDQEEDRNSPGVRLATMHRVKGLEFDTMIVAAVNDGVMPLARAMSGSDAVALKEQEKSERALLYVAVTRARKQVLITGQEPLSQFFQEVPFETFESK